MLDTNLVSELRKVKAGRAHPGVAAWAEAVEAEVARRSAGLHVPVPGPQPFRDGLIAATALVRNLVVVTRNLADFQASGVKLLNPWRLR